MNDVADHSVQSAPAPQQGRWKLFFGLSRTPHGVLDMATPAMAALLMLGHFPPLSVIIVGLVTAFAGYTAVYALNDLVDYRIDRERLALRGDTNQLFHVDAILARHPLAQSMLPLWSGVLWFLFWAAVAVIGAWWLNPFCVVIFCVSALMEAIYCKLLRITHLKIIPSVVVKASGGLAGIYAVQPDPSLSFAVLIFLWLSAWEIGGQNVANDIVDRDDDIRVSARTTATVKGLREAVFVLVSAVSIASFAGVVIYWFAGAGVGLIYPIGAVVLGWKLLLEPAREVYRDPGAHRAASLFNKASYMPLAFLILTAISILMPD
ncbi:MAG: ubiquinone biosynthesis protein UbiA [Deltaproteobacteria bacterium]|nr:ubiquinone biosynthesis protein UbiA [Deltaproteobacteria bacterium]